MNLLKNDNSKWSEILVNGLSDFEIEQLEINYPLDISDTREIFFKETLPSKLEQYNDTEIELIDPYDVINQLQNEPCCHNHCLDKIPELSLVNRMVEFRKMDKTDREKAILIILKLGLNNRFFLEKEQQRVYFEFLFNKKFSICRNAFMQIHNISLRQLKRIQKIATNQSYQIPEHGNKGRKPTHTISEKEADNVRQFLELFASNHAMPLPGGLAKSSKTGMMLPVHYNYKKIWELYIAGSPSTDVLSYRSFINVWQSGCEHILFRGPGTDLCDTCLTITNKLMRTRSEEGQKLLLSEINEHVADYSLAREQYKKNIEKSKNSWNKLKKTVKKNIINQYDKNKYPTSKVIPCSTTVTAHYSFDFSQKVYYPFSPYQRSSSYFLMPRKCDIFGIVNDTISKEVLFLTDELEFVDKGSNAVISYLHAFFELYGLGEKVVYLQADNCVGQNKNKYVMWYLLWRTLNNLHEKITLSFMVKGHTKFSPDGYFGLFKIQYQKENIDWMGDVIKCVREASNNSIIPLPYGLSLKRKEPFYQFYDWKSFLSTIFKEIPKITSYNYFSCNNKDLGILKLKSNPDGEDSSLSLLKNKHKRFTGSIKMPKIIKPLGLDPDRQEYLSKKISRLVIDPKNKHHYTLDELSQ
jgi:hypothetical protein